MASSLQAAPSVSFRTTEAQHMKDNEAWKTTIAASQHLSAFTFTWQLWQQLWTFDKVQRWPGNTSVVTDLKYR